MRIANKNQKSFKEKRKFPRIIVEYDTDVSSNRGVVLNMSSAGLFIATDEPFLEGTKIDITFPSLNDCPLFHGARVCNLEKTRGHWREV